MPPTSAALRTPLSRTLDSLGGALSQGPHRAPAHALSGQHQAGPGSGGLWGHHAFLPHQGHRSAGAPAWVALGLARPGRDAGTWAGTLPLGAPGFFLQAPQPRAGEYRGGFQAGKGRSRCVPDVGTCSRKRKAEVQRPSPHPPSASPGAQAWRSSSFPFCPGSSPLCSRSPASFAPAGCGQQGPALALAS